MNDPTLELVSWGDTETRVILAQFLKDLDEVPPNDRVAVFDNDGTLWAERPNYVQDAFFRHGLAQRTANESGFVVPAGVKDVLTNGPDVITDYDLHELAAEFNSIFEGLTPVEFDQMAQSFVRTDINEHFARPHIELRYQPMLELLAAMRKRGCDCFIITGGGTEFVRSISWEAYQVLPDHVVGTLIDYVVEHDSGTPVLRRQAGLFGSPNEGDAKVKHIQQSVGRRPIFAAGNSAGDGPMLDYAQASDGPSLALLVDHDDDEREVAYRSVAATFADDRSIVDVAHESQWLVVSMRNDWLTVF